MVLTKNPDIYVRNRSCRIVFGILCRRWWVVEQLKGMLAVYP